MKRQIIFVVCFLFCGFCSGAAANQVRFTISLIYPGGH